MTDSEINTLIADIEGRCSTPDYCNDWADIGPIIEREGIGLTSLVGGWIANIGYKFSCEEDTPTKAAALCYLKMRESE